MYGAGQRRTTQPDRFDPSNYIHSPVLPVPNLDTTMGTPNGDPSQPLINIESPTVDSLQKQINDINTVFQQQFESLNHRLSEYNEKFQELSIRVGEVEIGTTQQLTRVQSEFHEEFVNLQGHIADIQTSNASYHDTTLQDSIQHTNSVQQQINAQIQSLTGRVCFMEGQSARLAAVENKVKNISFTSPTPAPPPRTTQAASRLPPISISHALSSNILSSTVLPQAPISNNSIPPHSISAINNSRDNQSLYNNNSNLSNNVSQLSSISMDPNRIPKYNGQLTPVHPADFLDKVDHYFLIHNAPDQVKINFVSDNFTGKALLWYTTLLPPPLIYAEFVTLFRDYFWSPSLQRQIRNELYRPYYHEDPSTLSEHAMDWINRARHLQPPIEQVEMVDQIISHFSYHLSLALRGLRILTTNDLVKELTYLQRSNGPSSAPNTPNNNNSNSHSQQPNSYNNSSGPSRQNNYPPRQNNYPPRQNNYPPRQNNYHRPQYPQSQNQAPSQQPEQGTPPTEN
ncbi:unnamed protein product [Macrosiphum euphorbiae]|uniref:Retrotransposon gag domain-containing protein n=1 Tax=Macrosiphum euphorbiae TaxID=13131 RepID=A0AAV0WQK7_9HEMI|nr:unnamed protein product [Macrosiphum euphorbiae]